MSSILYQLRYPCERTKYNKIVGKARVDNFSNILDGFGFQVYTAEVETHGVDIWVYDELDQLKLVAEITNFQRSPVISEAKAESIRNGFSNYDCLKLIVFSFATNYLNRINELPKIADILIVNF
jgi:hypothetical protein